MFIAAPSGVKTRVARPFFLVRGAEEPAEATLAGLQPVHSAAMVSTDPVTIEMPERVAESELGLALVWSRYEPDRVGEMVIVGPYEPRSTGFVLGRRGASETGEARAEFVRARPDERISRGPFSSAKISRRQLLITPREDGRLEVVNVGRGAMLINDQARQAGTVGVGDRIEIESRALLLCVRPPELRGLSVADFPFAEADALGIIGESAASWELRAKILFFAKLDGHILIRGPSGTGKELVAAGLHRLSRRAKAAPVACNAAAIPESLIDAELFGNARNYPNPGMRERPGLVGEAHGSTLFLDEIGELSHSLQAHLLRVMDQGEYRRLGESSPRTADLRMIAATNRPTDELKHDLVARFALAVETPGLDRRREDIPLLARHLLRGLLVDGGALSQEGAPPIGLGLIKHLLCRDYVGHVRELRQVLAASLADARGAYLEAPRGAVQVGRPTATRSARIERPRPPAPPGSGPSRDEILGALEDAQWVLERAWPALGLSSRHQLRRLLKRHGIERPQVHTDPADLTREQVVAALKANNYVKTDAARALGLRSRHQLARLLLRLGITRRG